MDNDLLCNFRKCRKRLSSHAWITSCSHIFCDEDGTREFNKSYSCPACDTNLSGKYDFIRVDLQPPEQYKSLVLAGQRPEVIMEICSRALSFWTYQTHQERLYQEHVANKSKEKISQLEQYYEQIVSKTQTEITSLKAQISNTTKELDQTKKRYNEVSEKMMQKNRQYLKLQGMYDSLRRKSITPGLLGAREDRVLDTRIANTTHAFDIPFCSGTDLLCRTNSMSNVAHCQPAEKEFVLQTTIPDQRQGRCPPSVERQFPGEVNSSFSLNFGGTPGITRRLINKEGKQKQMV